MSGRLKASHSRKNQFKKGFDSEASKKKRDDIGVEIRKSKKEESLSKKRQVDATPPVQFSSTSSSSYNFDPKDLKLTPERLQLMVMGVMSDDLNSQLECTTHFRKVLSIEKHPPIDQVINANVVPRFVQFLRFEHCPPLQFEAAWALTNIASGVSEQTRVVIDNGAVPIFVELLASPNEEVREQAVWALGNIAGDSTYCRDFVLRHNALHPLLSQLHAEARPTMVRNATWTLSNFCRGKPAPLFEMVRPALPILAQLIYVNDEEVLTDACWALSYLSDGPNEKIQAVVDAGVCRRMVELLLHVSVAVQTPALRTIGNIVTGDEGQTQMVLNSSVLPCLLQLLGSPRKGIRKEACWTISNVTAGSKEQIGMVIQADIFPPLIYLLETADYDIKKEAAWAISNATSGGSPEQLHYMVEKGCIKPLCDLLTMPESRIVIVALEGLEHILQRLGELLEKQYGYNPVANQIDECGGLAKIDNLQNHQNPEIYDKALKMLVKYFNAVEEDQNLAPVTDAQSQTYKFGIQNAPSTYNFSK